MIQSDDNNRYDWTEHTGKTRAEVVMLGIILIIHIIILQITKFTTFNFISK